MNQKNERYVCVFPNILCTYAILEDMSALMRIQSSVRAGIAFDQPYHLQSPVQSSRWNVLMRALRSLISLTPLRITSSLVNMNAFDNESSRASHSNSCNWIHIQIPQLSEASPQADFDPTLTSQEMGRLHAGLYLSYPSTGS